MKYEIKYLSLHCKKNKTNMRNNIEKFILGKDKEAIAAEIINGVNGERKVYDITKVEDFCEIANIFGELDTPINAYNNRLENRFYRILGEESKTIIEVIPTGILFANDHIRANAPCNLFDNVGYDLDLCDDDFIAIGRILGTEDGLADIAFIHPIDSNGTFRILEVGMAGVIRKVVQDNRTGLFLVPVDEETELTLNNLPTTDFKDENNELKTINNNMEITTSTTKQTRINYLSNQSFFEGRTIELLWQKGHTLCIKATDAEGKSTNYIVRYEHRGEIKPSGIWESKRIAVDFE